MISLYKIANTCYREVVEMSGVWVLPSFIGGAF